MIVAVLDVNVIISAVLGALGFPRQVVDALRAGRFVVATSAGITAEVESKLRLPRISRRFLVQQRSLPKSFIQLCARSTTQCAPAWSGAGTPLRAIAQSTPSASSRAGAGRPS